MSLALTAAALTVAAPLAAMAASAPLSGSSRVNATSAQTPVTAVFVLLVGLGAVAITALAILVWPRRRAEEPGFKIAPPQVHWLWKVLACVLPFLLGAALVIAALLGTHALHAPTRLPVGGAPVRSVTPSPAAKAPGSGFVLPGWVPWTVLLVLIAAVALVVVFLVRRGRSSAPEPAEPDTVRAAAGAAIGALDATDDPRQAVIAAYVAMEGTFAVNGLPRTESEAPREYLERVLVAEGVVDRDARTLTGLFETARFSPHPVSARMRDRARSGLAGLHSGLGGP